MKVQIVFLILFSIVSTFIFGNEGQFKPTFKVYHLDHSEVFKVDSSIDEFYANLNKLNTTYLKNIDELPVKFSQNTWFKFDITLPSNASETDLQEWFFHMRASHQSKALAYYFIDGKLVANQEAGYKVPFIDRPIFSSDIFLNFRPKLNSKMEIFVLTKPESKMPFWPTIKNTKEVSSYLAMDLVIISGYISILLILMFYQLFVFQIIKDRASLDYALFCLTMSLSAIGRCGYFDMLLGNKLGFYFGDWMIYFVGLNSFTAMQFPRSYFNMKATSPKMDNVFKGFLITVFVLYLFSIIFNPHLLHKFVPSVNLLAGVIAIGYSIYGIKNKIVGSFYYLVAWGGFVILISYYNMTLLGALQMPSYMRYLTYFAGLWESYLTAIGLSYRLKRYKEIESAAVIRERENNALHRFVRILCHDVANPLMVISANVQILKKRLIKEDDISSQEKLKKISNSVEVITNIINDVRTFEAFRSKKIKDYLHIQKVDLHNSLKNTLEIFEEKLIQKNIVVDISEVATGLYVKANEHSLKTSVYSNILSNAIKFSYQNQKIKISTKEDDEFIELIFEDQGMGIPDELLAKLFTHDENTSRLGTMQEKGTGFGMLLIKEIVENFGGSINIFSKDESKYPTEHGTVVHIRLIRDSLEN